MKLYSRKRKNPIKILILVALISAIAFAISKQFINKDVDDVVVAQIASENIYKSDIEKKLKEVFANNPNAKVTFEKLPNQVVEVLAREVFLDKKIVAEAKKVGIDNDPEVRDSIESYKVNAIRQAYMNDALKNLITDQRIVEKFNELNSEIENKNEYKFLEIAVKDQSKIDTILKDLKKKKSVRFIDLVKKYSTAKGSVSEVDLEYKSESLIPKETLEILKNLKQDEVSKPFEIDGTWRLVKLLDTRKPKPIEFESAKEYVRHLIKLEEIEKVNGKFLQDNKVKLLINNDLKGGVEENKEVDDAKENKSSSDESEQGKEELEKANEEQSNNSEPNSIEKGQEQSTQEESSK